MEQFDWQAEFDALFARRARGDENIKFSPEAHAAAGQWPFCALGEKYQLARLVIPSELSLAEVLRLDDNGDELPHLLRPAQNLSSLIRSKSPEQGRLGMNFYYAVCDDCLDEAFSLYKRFQEMPTVINVDEYLK